MSADQVPYWSGREDGEAHWVLGGLYTYKALTEQVGGDYTAIEVRARGGMAIPVHYHDEETEAFYVADGAGDAAVRRGRGDGGSGLVHLRTASPTLTGALSSISQEDRHKAWKEIEQVLSKFEGPEGFEVDHRVLIAAATAA